MVSATTEDLFDDGYDNETNEGIGFSEEEKQIKISVEMMQTWSGAQEMRIIFDSDVDDWSNNSSTFLQKVLKKNNLYFVIEDFNGNIFGGYICEEINKHGYGNNGNIFVFNLNSRNDKKDYSFPRRFLVIEEDRGAYYVGTNEDDTLFAFGVGKYDIHVHKKYSFNSNWCVQKTFEYRGLGNALCYSTYFKVSRIIIIDTF